MRVEGSIALVTGANRGLGKALVAALLEAGAAKVYAAARDARGVEPDPRVVAITIDTGRPEQIAAAAARASDVTLLVNNAGVLRGYDVLSMTRGDAEADFRTNVLGTLDVIKAFVPVLERASKGSAVVNVLSVAALASFPALGGYAASKAAAYSVTQAMRPALAAKGIAVLAALPGPIDTDMVKALPMPKASAQEVAAGIVLGIVRGDQEIFPDAMSEQLSLVWRRSSKELERVFASM